VWVPTPENKEVTFASHYIHKEMNLLPLLKLTLS